METAKTKPYRPTLSGSIGAGMGSIFNGNGRKYYILEHKVSSQYHHAGESQEIIIDNIELGRASTCQVRFDERFTTVSRHHAAIVRDGDMWKLVQISKTNSTLLNGRPVQNEWYLQNGDEIQLSVGGPRLGFIIPTGNKATVGSIGLTRRLSLFRQQALAPYKKALWSLAACLLLCICVGGFVIYNQGSTIEKQGKELAEQISANKENTKKAAELAEQLHENNKKLKDYEQRIAGLTKEVADANRRAAIAARKAQEAISTIDNVITDDEQLKAVAKSTYFCVIALYLEGEVVDACSGTGFLLDDGKFVTAQHVINPWSMLVNPEDKESLLLNALINQAPSLFSYKMIAVSSSGDRIEMTFTHDKHPFRMGRCNKETIGTINFQGMDLPIQVVDDSFSSKDYAWIQRNKKGSIHADFEFSKSMPIKTHLDILGFPKGVGAEDINNISPIFSESSVARDGIDVDGCILLSNSETDHGNSGGPVFARKDGQLVAVGILSGANRLGSKIGKASSDSKWKDRVVPIAYIR